MIAARGLSKRFGATRAVDDLSFTVPGGTVTGFLGPNGAGKSTTMRMILGLDRPGSGTATIDGQNYRDLAAPSRTVGAMLEMGNRQVRLTGRAHLEWQARAARIRYARIGEVLELTGLTEVAGRRIRGYSLGMRQRLGLASALLGDPEHLILDEPVNGLDPQGIQWMRALVTGLADEGRTVFLSSHLLSEMEAVADRIVVIGGGRMIAEAAMSDLTRRCSTRSTAASPQAEQLARVVQLNGGQVRWEEHDERGGTLSIDKLPTARIGELAADHHITLHGLTGENTSLEHAFMELTSGSVEVDSVRDGREG